MPLLNSPAGYGALTKLFHWLIALLMYISANIMLHTPAETRTLGLGQGTYYNWHKSARARCLPNHVRAPHEPPDRGITAVCADADADRANNHPPHRATALWDPPHHAAERLPLCHGGELPGIAFRSGTCRSDRSGSADGRDCPMGARGVRNAVAVAARNSSRPGARSPFQLRDQLIYRMLPGRTTRRDDQAYLISRGPTPCRPWSSPSTQWTSIISTSQSKTVGPTPSRACSNSSSNATAPLKPSCFVHVVAQRLTRGEAAAVVEQDIEAAVVEVGAEACGVRGDQHVGGRPEGMVGGERLDLEDVEGCPAISLA